MDSKYADDDEIFATQNDIEGDKLFSRGKVKLAYVKCPEKAPLEKSKIKVMLELTGTDSPNNRCGLDLVMVLDVSGSMEGDKLEKMKIAMQFVIRKLSSIDRLSIVTFADSAERPCRLRQITNESREEIEEKVSNLIARGYTNISDGLETALKVLNNRRYTTRRSVGIMLMSDGLENPPTNKAIQVKVGKVPVYTFGFGQEYDARLLKTIAVNSDGGMFSDVQNQNNLSIAFSQSLAGLLTVALQKLELFIKPVDSTILGVSAGNYPHPKDDEDDSITVSFGNLYEREVRKVIVDLEIPAAKNEGETDCLNVTYAYSTETDTVSPDYKLIDIYRTKTPVKQEMNEEVKIEETRILTAKMIKKARETADDEENLEKAKNILVDTQNMLEDVAVKPNRLIEMLKYELRELLFLMVTEEIYRKQGRSFALSSEFSHDRQRFAVRGSDVDKIRFFATPRMDTFFKQVVSFVEDPSKPLPTVDDDVQQEIADKPFAPVAQALTVYIEDVVKALKSIQGVLNKLL